MLLYIYLFHESLHSLQTFTKTQQLRVLCGFQSGMMVCLKSDTLRLWRRFPDGTNVKLRLVSVYAIYVQDRRHVPLTDEERKVQRFCALIVADCCSFYAFPLPVYVTPDRK